MAVVDRILHRALIVESEVAMVRLMRFNLENVGFRVSVVEDEEKALEQIRSKKIPDIIVIDFSLPFCGASIIDFCSKLKEADDSQNIPVIVVSSRLDVVDRVRCLETCVDDFILKPFIPAEFVARIRAVLRRSRRSLAQDSMRVGDLVMNMANMQVTLGGSLVKLSIKEFKLLQRFMEYPEKVYSRNQLLSLVWDDPSGVDVRTIDVHINRLRVALRDAFNADSSKSFIRTVRGSGYCLNASSLELKSGSESEAWSNNRNTGTVLV